MFLYMTSVVYCRIFLHFMSSLFNYLKKINSENVSTPKVGVLNVEFALKLRIYRFNMSQMNPKGVLHNLHTQFNYLTSLPLRINNSSYLTRKLRKLTRRCAAVLTSQNPVEEWNTYILSSS